MFVFLALQRMKLAVNYSSSLFQKVYFTADLSPSRHGDRGWFISPFGISETVPVWLPFAATLPGALMFLILFVEVEVTEYVCTYSMPYFCTLYYNLS